MKSSSYNIAILSILILTGCASSLPNVLNMNNTQELSTTEVSFRTNQAHFLNSLSDNTSRLARNAYLDEFILKSDLQCQNYLNRPLQSAKVDQNKDSLYMNLFDTVSGIFGFSLATTAAKAVFLDSAEASQEEKQAYANALSPEIRKGVEIGRKRYAKKMMHKKSLNLKDYSIDNLKEDMLIYDKQCNDAYGLIEINRALRAMQNTVHSPSSTNRLKIDPRVIKAKVEATSKEVEKKKIEKKKSEEQKTKVKIFPKQPKLEDVLLHHDNAQ